jgi:hypothetical protein
MSNVLKWKEKLNIKEAVEDIKPKDVALQEEEPRMVDSVRKKHKAYQN